MDQNQIMLMRNRSVILSLDIHKWEISTSIEWLTQAIGFILIKQS